MICAAFITSTAPPRIFCLRVKRNLSARAMAASNMTAHSADQHPTTTATAFLAGAIRKKMVGFKKGCVFGMVVSATSTATNPAPCGVFGCPFWRTARAAPRHGAGASAAGAPGRRDRPAGRQRLTAGFPLPAPRRRPRTHCRGFPERLPQGGTVAAFPAHRGAGIPRPFGRFFDLGRPFRLHPLLSVSSPSTSLPDMAKSAPARVRHKGKHGFPRKRRTFRFFPCTIRLLAGPTIRHERRR